MRKKRIPEMNSPLAYEQFLVIKLIQIRNKLGVLVVSTIVERQIKKSMTKSTLKRAKLLKLSRIVVEFVVEKNTNFH